MPYRRFQTQPIAEYRSLAFLLCLALCVAFSNGYHLSGEELITSEQWHFMGKFCFSNQFATDTGGARGHLNWNIKTQSKTMKIVLYLDTEGEGSFERAYGLFKSGNYTCDQLVQMRRKDVSGVPGHLVTKDSVNPYYWFVAVADCDNAKGLHLHNYTMTFLNPVPHTSQDLWYEQFSYDQQGLGQAYIFFFILFVVCLGVHLFGVSTLIREGSYHTVTTVGLAMLVLSTFFYVIHYGVFAKNGVGSPGAAGLGLALSMLSQVLFMFMCILIAKGWTITTNHLDQAIIVKVVMAIVMILYISLFIWNYVGNDPASTIYFWDSAVGFLAVMVRMIVYVWFCWSLRQTHILEESAVKRKFYVIFGGLASAWFLLLPFFVLVALGIPVYERYRVITGFTLVIDSLGFLCMIVLFWPSRVGNYFSLKPTPLQTTLVYGGGSDTAQGSYDTL